MRPPADSVHRLILFHKPKGLVVTRSDERNRTTVYDRLPPFFREGGWVPVGRLDKESRGLLLFTRHGYLVDRLTHPGYCEKIYEVIIRGRLSDKNFSRALRGVETPWGVLGVHVLELMRVIGPKTFLRVTLTEGKNRHIRRLFHSFEDPEKQTPLKVLDLKRVQIGSLKLDIPSGQWRYVTRQEESNLLAALPPSGPFPGNSRATP